MANLVVSDEGERYLLDTTLRTPLAVSETWHVHLYTNDYDPLADVTLADLVEMSLPGYAAQPLDRALWPASTTSGGQAGSVYAGNPVMFAVTSGMANAFGFFVTDESDAVLLWVERFDTYQAVDPLHPGQARVSLTGRSQSEPT